MAGANNRRVRRIRHLRDTVNPLEECISPRQVSSVVSPQERFCYHTHRHFEKRTSNEERFAHHTGASSAFDLAS